MTIGRTVDAWLTGIAVVLDVLIILTHAWVLAGVADDLATGTSWDTMGSRRPREEVMACVVVGVDGSAASKAALPWVIAEARSATRFGPCVTGG